MSDFYLSFSTQITLKQLHFCSNQCWKQKKKDYFFLLLSSDWVTCFELTCLDSKIALECGICKLILPVKHETIGIVDRGFLIPPILWRSLRLYSIFPFFQIFSKATPIPYSTQPPHFFFCLVSLTEILCFILLKIVDLYMPILGIIVPQGPCSVFYAKRHQFTEV